jgi:hypothetical protein
MKHMIMAGGTVALLLGLAAAPARAQTAVSGGVVVRSGPVTGHVEVGSPPPPVVVVREPAREVIVVERTHVPHGEAHGWWKEHGYREVTVYYDGSHYYGHRVDGRGSRPWSSTSVAAGTTWATRMATAITAITAGTATTTTTDLPSRRRRQPSAAPLFNRDHLVPRTTI